MSATNLLEVTSAEKVFPLTRSVREMFAGTAARGIHAVDGVDIAIAPGETLGLIGESGSGKTTLGWLVARIHEPTGGALKFEGKEVTHLRGDELRQWRANVQVVFQDPVGSLDPRLRVWQIVGETFWAQHQLSRRFARRERARIQRENRAARNKGSAEPPVPLPSLLPRLTRDVIRAKVQEALVVVGLPPDCIDQYPHEFSGGGRQRLSLARALIVNPKLVILDEPTSALDVAVQAQILNRLVELQRERHIAFLLITHNVAAVRFVADRVAVMYLGRVVEVGSVRSVLERPIHPYTKALLAAVPVPDARRRKTYYRIGGDIPTMIDPPPGCRFAPRCPFVVDRCRQEYPALREIPGAAGQLVSCHRAEEVMAIPPESLLSTEATVPVANPPPVS